jgi:hypothetical protein
MKIERWAVWATGREDSTPFPSLFPENGECLSGVGNIGYLIFS